MASELELRNLRQKMARVLKSPACLEIRFSVDNVTIQTFMYTYIATAILEDRVHLHIGAGNGYDHKSNTITLASLDAEAPTFVHEATHAIIDATHVGQRISVGTHETSAYLAETVYALNANDHGHVVDVPHLTRPLYQLARRVVAFNQANKSGRLVCPPSEVLSIKSLIGNSALRQDVGRIDEMNGISEGPRRGLIGSMLLEHRRATAGEGR